MAFQRTHSQPTKLRLIDTRLELEVVVIRPENI